MKIEKVVSSLPSTLVADTVYLIRVGTGFDVRVVDSTGSVAHILNDTYVTVSGNTVFAYSNDKLSLITYPAGDYKTFTYTSDVLSQIDHVIGLRTVRKDFTYTDGLLTNILESEL